MSQSSNADYALLNPLAVDNIGDEVKQLLQRLTLEKSTEVQDVEIKESSIDVQSALVLYNPFSLDSLMAAMLLTSCRQKFDAATQSHHFIDNSVNVDKVDTVIAVGMEVNSDLLTHMLESNKKLTVVLIGYRDSYEWLEKKEHIYRAKSRFSKKEPGFYETITQSALYKKYQERITLLRPSNEYFGDLIAKTDNTLTKVTQFWLQSSNFQMAAVWREYADLVARVYGMSYPLTGLTPEDEAEASPAVDAANRVKLHELSVRLRAALGAHKPQERLKEMVLTPNLDNYRAHKTMMEEMFARSMHDHSIPAAVGTYHKVRIAQMSENVVNDLIALPSIASKDVVFYTDIRRFRVWRVYSPNHGKARAIVACFKPTAQWSEGMFACGITYVEGIA